MGAASTRSSTNVPDRVGRYEILLPIASGGMATVYLARAVGPNGFETEVALKLTHAHLRSSTEFSNDLVEEGKLAARIRHRNVVSVIDVGDDPSGLYLVMEYIEGDTLAGLVRGSKGSTPIPLPMRVRLLVDALAGLQAAHELRDEAGNLVGVVHRDFTPHNILVGTDGVARLADFGIAKAATRLGHTRTGIVKGKIAYMSPEQAHGLPLDRRCDVWAAGVVAWELFAGRRLHPTEDDVATLLRVATVTPPRLRTVVPDLPLAVDDAVAGALTMSVNDRHPTALAFARELVTACRTTVGVAEVDEIAAWMACHVTPRVSGQRLQAARQRGRLDATGPTRSEPVQGTHVSESVVLLDESDVLSMQTAPARPEPAPTVMVPTLVAEQETRHLTDGVSVVARHLRTARSAAPGPRALLVGGILGAILIATVTVWRASTTRGEARSPEEAPAPPAALATTASAAPNVAPATTPATPATPATIVRVRANAAIAALRVNDHAVPIERPASTVAVDVSSFGGQPAITIDAVAVDGRRAGVAVPAGATDVRLEFRAPSPPPQFAPARAVAPRQAPPSAPLAPSPY